MARAPFVRGDLALIVAQPFLPPVRVDSCRPLRWGGWRVSWRHEAPGFGKAPQFSDEPRDGRLVAVPAGYVAPADWRWLSPSDHRRAQLAYLDRHAAVLRLVHGRDRLAQLHAHIERRLAERDLSEAAPERSAA